MMKEAYLQFAGMAADNIWAQHPDLFQRALQEKGKVGYLPYAAMVDATRYTVTKERRYLEQAKEALLEVHRFYELLAERTGEATWLTETPMLDWMFEPAPYARAYMMIKQDAGFTETELSYIERVLESSVNPIFTFPEHGAENRCALKACNLIYGAEAFPENPMAKKWVKMALHMLADSVNHWSIEDASTYNTLWMHVLYSVHQIHPLTRLEENPFLLYYCRYLLGIQLNCGVFADYGDGRWGSDWAIAVACLEKAAGLFHSGEMKYAAEACFSYMQKLDKGASFATWKTLPVLIDAYFWSDSSIVPVRPEQRSQNVLDDLVGKKIAFRSGENQPEAYMLLNYRDEGNYGILPRHNLRTSLAVRAEKMHHGHGDENSIAVLSVNDCILLHDGGYRGQLAGGRWRADYYHNKVITRNGALDYNEGVYDFLMDAGNYIAVETEQLYFYAFDRLDSSRTRIYNPEHCTVTDRCVHYLKEENAFLVVDIILPQRKGEYTFACLYHNRFAERLDSHRFLTYSDYIGADEYLDKIPNNTETKLLVDFLNPKLPTDAHPINRCYTEETSFCQYFTGIADGNSNIVMVSLLLPQKEGETVSYTAHCQQNELGNLTTIAIQGKQYQIFDRFRVEGNISDLNKRPAYCFEKGNSNLGGLESDGLFTAVVEEKDACYYAFVDATRVDYNGKTLFQNQEIEHYQLDFTNKMGVSSWSSWDEQL